VLNIDAAAVRLVVLAIASLPLLFGLHIRTEKHHLTRLGLPAALFEGGGEPDTAPHAVAQQAAHALWPRRVPGALQRDRLFALVRTCLQLIERELARALDEAANPQAERRGIDGDRLRLVKRVVLVVRGRPRRQPPQIEAAHRRIRRLRIDLALREVVAE